MRQWRIAGAQLWLGYATLLHGAQHPSEGRPARRRRNPIAGLVRPGIPSSPTCTSSVRLHDKKVDPFAYGQDEGACAAGRSLWDAALRDKLSYRQREIVNFGFADGPAEQYEPDPDQAKYDAKRQK